MTSSLRRWPTLALVALSIAVHLCRYSTEGVEHVANGWGVPQGTGADDDTEEDNRHEDGHIAYTEIRSSRGIPNNINRQSLKDNQEYADFLGNHKYQGYGGMHTGNGDRFKHLIDIYSSLTPGNDLRYNKQFGNVFHNREEQENIVGPIKEELQHETSDVRREHETLIPMGKIYDIALDANDTRHFYWRLLKEGKSDTTNQRLPDIEGEDGDWSADEVQAIRGEVHARGAAPLAWLAIGFSNRGQLTGADMCVLWTDWRGRIHFQSALVDGNGRLVAEGIEGTLGGVCRGWGYKRQRGLLKMTFYRRLDPCTPGYSVIQRGTSYLMWSYGAGPLNQLSGVAAAGDQTGVVKVQLLKPPVEVDNSPQSELKVVMHLVPVPATETNYWCLVQRLSDAFESKHHVLQYAPHIQPGNEDLVHHMEVFHCELPPHQEVPLYQGPCRSPKRPSAINACKRVLAAWAMGASAFSYPKETGLPIGGAGFNRHIMLELHYNNPGHIAGRIDSSGMVLYYTPHLRQYDASIMELGLEYSDKMGIPPRVQAFVLSGYCVPECTALGLPSRGMYVFGSQLHTHLTGVRVWTKHFRNGEELPELNRDNQYSPHFQEIRRLPQPVHVLPGDSLVTSCEYTTLDRTNITVGGLAISDEMCVNYIHYYPKSQLEVCKSSIDTTALRNYFDFMKRYELQPTSPSESHRANLHSVKWTPLRTQYLAELYDTAPLSMQCNRSSGARFSGFWDGIKIPLVTHQLPEHQRKCQSGSIKENMAYADE